MKRWTISALTLVCLGVGVSVTAQSRTIQGLPNLNEFHVLSQKRADVRLEITRKGFERAYRDWLKNRHPAEYSRLMARLYNSEMPHRTVHSGRFVMQAQRHPRLADFHSSMNKRGDIRLDIVRHGMDMAFIRWMQQRHPLDYRQAQQKWQDTLAVNERAEDKTMIERTE